jgi:hypothetical protein
MRRHICIALVGIVGIAIVHFFLAAFSLAYASGRRMPRIHGDNSWMDSVNDAAVQVLWFPPAGSLWVTSAIWGVVVYGAVWLLWLTIRVVIAEEKTSS